MIEEYNLSFLRLDQIKTSLLNIPAAVHTLVNNGKSSFNIGPTLFYYPEFKVLEKIIRKYVIIYCNKNNIDEQKFINSWFNISNPGNKLEPHHHGEMGLSGAFYVSAHQQSAPLIFPQKSIKPYSGLLIIFPSNLVHYTNTDIGQRIVISFNTTPKLL